MNREELELVGSALYKCEGTKLRKDERYKNTFLYHIEFTNSEPCLIKLFLKFLRQILKIDEGKLRCELFLYPTMNIDDVRKKWEKITNIKPSNFQKIIILKEKSSKFKPNPLGTCKIRLCSKEIYLKMNQIIIKRLGIDASLIK
jgi:hypothetical protein